MNPADPVASSPSVAHPPLDPRVRCVLFAAVFLVAIALRVEYVCEIWPHPAAQLPLLDAEAYRKIALEIRAGDWLGDAVYYLDPLYPFFLAAIYSIVEPDTRGVLLVQALLDSLSVVFVMLIARRVFGDRSAFAAGVIAATYSLFFYYDGLLQKEALMIFLLVAGLYAIVRAAESDRARAWLPAGGLIGLAALTRGNSLLFAPALLLWIAVQGRGTRRARGLAALCFTLGIAAAVLPVTLRNFVVGHDLVLLNSQAGQNFYIGNFRGNRTGSYLAPPFLRPNPEVEEQDFAAEAKRRSGRSDLAPSEISSFWLREGLAEIAADPAHFVAHTARKLLVFMNAYEIPDNSSFEYFQRNVAPMLNLPFPGWAFVLPLSLAGMWMARKRPLAWILILFFISYTAGLLLFFNLSRMRLPVVPVAIGFAGFALVECFERLRARDLRSLAIPAALALALVPVTHIALPHQPLNVRYYNLGSAFLTRSEAAWKEGLALRSAGDLVAAQAAFTRSLTERSRADGEWARGLDQFPSYERLRSALRNSLLARVVALDALELYGPALDAALDLTARFDRFPGGFVRLALAYERLHRPSLAERAFARAQKLDPDNAAAAAGLARLKAELESDAASH